MSIIRTWASGGVGLGAECEQRVSPGVAVMVTLSDAEAIAVREYNTLYL